MARVETALTGDLAILQGETYQALSLEFPGDLTTWTPRGQIRTKLLEESGTLLAEFSFATPTYDAATDTTTIYPRLTPDETASLPKTKWQGTGEYSKTAVYYYDVELVSDTEEVVKSKTAIVQVIGEVTGAGIPPTNTTETFLTDPGSGTTGQLLARASDNIGDVTWVNAGHGGLLDADTLDGQEGTYYQGRANHTGTQAIATVSGLQTALDSKEPADATILKDADIGVTVQGYSANTVIDVDYSTVKATALSATQPVDLSTVATTGAYSDLSGLPTLGTAAATASIDYATAAQGALADTALQPTETETVSGNYTFNGALYLPNNSRINNIEHFYQTTKPTTRGDSSALVAGDRWWKTDDGTEWFWNGTYWIGDAYHQVTSNYYSPNTRTFANFQNGLFSTSSISFVYPFVNYYVESVKLYILKYSSIFTGTLDASNYFEHRVGNSTAFRTRVDDLSWFNDLYLNGRDVISEPYVVINNTYEVFADVYNILNVTGSPTLTWSTGFNASFRLKIRQIYL